MHILAIDPGPEFSAYVGFDTEKSEITRLGKDDNVIVQRGLRVIRGFDQVVIEMIACYGMPVGRDVFETCVWIGRFMEAWGCDEKLTRLPRRAVKLHLCNSARAKDANVRQALIDRFGGKQEAIGKKASPGPLYGVKGDLWAALGVAVTFAEMN